MCGGASYGEVIGLSWQKDASLQPGREEYHLQDAALVGFSG